MKSVQASLTVLDRLLYDGEALRMGLVVAPPQHPAFREDGPVHHHAIQFHTTAIAIERERGVSVADPHVITFFAKGEGFRRRAIDPSGERSFWIAYDTSFLSGQGIEHFKVADAAFAGRAAYLSHVALRVVLGSHGGFEPLAVEERALEILDQALALPARGARVRPDRGCAGRGNEAGLADDVRSLLALRYADALSLAEIARSVNSSPYHLARVFRKVTGRSIHGYRNGLRLREALNMLSGGAADLARVALDLGYSSHSHFTSQFKAAFGLPPTAVRAHCDLGDYAFLFAVADRLTRLAL